ncbi:TetR family transcriptional regulator [Mycobacterium sp. SM1]|uniref:TetR family transcriptional regulator n=1 Tax=Mycobacterium sp. SM1 TaxID=2816243 RepID=UPI001BCC1C7E|nr:TetR family transcriptional regulator [Mycobacterium sp. SM1]MBS4730329.1 TetR family transcriptional regulator [Mycobacterium sp. SM1]
MTQDCGSLIRDARLRAGLTTRAVAERMQLSPATISAIEKGKTGVSVARLAQFAEALDIPLERLLPPAATMRSNRRPDTFAIRAPNTGDWRIFPPMDLDPPLSAAIDAFVETGYHGSSMRDIAKRAGLSVPGVYHYYPDKQRLLVRILEITMDELHQRVALARAEAVDGINEVRLIVEALALFHTHRRKLAFIGASEMRSLTDVNRARITRSRNAIQHFIDDAIDRAVSENGWSTAEPRAVGRAIATMCTSLPQWFKESGPATPEDIAHTYAGLAIAMLRYGSE